MLDEPTDWTVESPTRWIIADLVSHEPYAYKDPRFSYTLNAWCPYLNRCKLVCVFRDPRVAATSIVREVALAPYTQNLKISADHALRVWRAMYRQILDFHCTDDAQWLFIEYDQLITGTGHEVLSKFLDAEIDSGFVEQQLNRSQPIGRRLDSGVSELYERLKAKAEVTQAAVLRGGDRRS